MLHSYLGSSRLRLRGLIPADEATCKLLLSVLAVAVGARARSRCRLWPGSVLIYLILVPLVLVSESLYGEHILLQLRIVKQHHSLVFTARILLV